MYIVFQKEIDGVLSAVAMSAAAGWDAADVARKDVPQGEPFLLREGPFDPNSTFDFSHPDGVGLGYDAWLAAQQAA